MITFVTPPSVFLLDECVFPSLGILKVAGAAADAGLPVEHLDLTGRADYLDRIRVHARLGRTRAYALTATTPQMPAVTRITSVIRQEAPNAKVILGGPHPTLIHAAARSAGGQSPTRQSLLRSLSTLRERFDCVVAGDGERAIIRACDDTRNEGVLDADDPRSSLWLTSTAIRENPWPARHLIDLSRYRYTIEGERATSLISQLGCPFGCGFCGGRSSPMLRRVRLRPPSSVLAELEHLYDVYGYRGFMFYDDELNVNREMVTLMQGIHALARSRGIQFRLRGFVKSELFTSEQAVVMYDAGFRWLLCGFESAHPRILTNINKRATLDDNTVMLRTARAHGLKVKALMSIGHPGESEQTILATRDWLLEMKPDDFDLTVITPYPGSPYHDEAVPLPGGVLVYTVHGDRLYFREPDFTADALYYKGVPGSYTSYVWTSDLTPERIASLRDQIEDEVRTRLGIPYPTGPAQSFEKAMGQT